MILRSKQHGGAPTHCALTHSREGMQLACSALMASKACLLLTSALNAGGGGGIVLSPSGAPANTSPSRQHDRSI